MFQITTKAPSGRKVFFARCFAKNKLGRMSHKASFIFKDPSTYIRML